VNPDGSERRQRRNAGDADLNRDHLTLFTPEVAALHQLYHEIQPHVTLDVHEYGIAGSAWVEAGLHKDFGQQIGALSNANMSVALRQYAWDRVIPTMRTQLASKDVFLRRYLVTDRPDARFRYSTTALNDGRNSMGIYHSLSFLTEGRNSLTIETEIRDRTHEQRETIKAFLDFFAMNAEEVKDLVIEAFHPRVEASLRVQRPLGYVIPAGLTEVIGVLERHRIELDRIEVPVPTTLETYRIVAVTPSRKEDKDFLEVGVTVGREESSVAPGDFIVWCDQPASNLIVSLLEPQSQWGLVPLPEFSGMLTVGAEYQIKRIVGTRDGSRH
jgi:hypothetical protein